MFSMNKLKSIFRGTLTVTHRVFKKHWFKNKRNIVILVAIVGLVGFLGWWYFSKPQTAYSPVPKSPLEKYTSVTPVQKADTLAFYGDYQGSQKLLDDEIAKTKDDASKSKLYNAKCLIAFNHKHYDDSLTFAQAAEKLAPSRITALYIAKSSEALHNKKLALEYYKKVIERTPQQMKDLDETINVDNEAKIKELSK